MMEYRKKIFSNSVVPGAILLALLIGISVSCDNSVNPLDEEEGIYSIFGFVDVNEGVNYIRVKDLKIPLAKDTTGSIDATVTLRDLNDGTSETLEDTIITFEGVATNNFKIDSSIKPETTYQLTVEGSDGRNVSATTTTPNIAETIVDPINENCFRPITISFEPVNRENKIQIGINFKLFNNTYGISRLLRSSVDNEKLSITMSPKQIMEEAFCRGPFFCSLPFEPCFLLDSEEFTVNYTQFGPDYEFGPDISNVSDSLTIPGGAGRFVGLLRDSFSFPIDTIRVGDQL